MKSSDPETAAPKRKTEDTLVHVIGPNLIQNELLTSFIEETSGFPCHHYDKMDISLKSSLQTGIKNMLLIDCLGEKNKDPWQLYNFNGITKTPGCYVSFYNVHAESGIENKALSTGIRGLFYHKESFKVIPKAIEAILDGELWYSRKTMSNCLLGSNIIQNRVSTDMASCLTEREREILIRIATGVGNQQIAEDLQISLHTVKTHIYNIYKKIDVKNRLQASLWAARFI